MKKKMVIVIVLICLFSLLALTLFLKSESNQSEVPGNNINTPDENKEEIKSYLVANNNKVFKYNGSKWEEAKELDYLDKYVNVYDGNNYVGERQISYTDGWYINDTNRNFYDLQSRLFAYYGDFKIDLLSVNELDFTEIDNNKIINYLKSKNLQFNSDNLFIDKYVLDLNEDQLLDSIYSVVNTDTLDEPLIGDSFEYLLYVYSDGSIQEISYKKEFDCSLELYNAIKMDNKKFLICGCSYPSIMGIGNKVFEYDGSFKTVLTVEP